VLGVEAEDQAGLGDHVDKLSEDVRHTVVPHGHAEQVVRGAHDAVEPRPGWPLSLRPTFSWSRLSSISS
jgi:hypothetical protein